MKIFKNNSVFVQKCDMANLFYYCNNLPSSILTNYFGSMIVIINDTNRYDFVEFNLPEEVEFFKNQDWIIDYDDVKDLSEDEIMAAAKATYDKCHELSARYQEKGDIDVVELKRLEQKMWSYRDILWFKQGHIKMTLPEGIDYPEGYSTGLKRLLNNLFGKRRRKID